MLLARQKVVRKLAQSPRPDYGFDYNEARDNYVVNEEEAQIVRWIFRAVGVEGHSLNSVKKAFDREWIATAERFPLLGRQLESGRLSRFASSAAYTSGQTRHKRFSIGTQATPTTWTGRTTG
jgi:hypothetical protein